MPPITPFTLNASLWILWLIYWNLAAIFVNRSKRVENHWQRFQYSLPMGLGFWLIFHNRNGGSYIHWGDHVGRYTESVALEWVGNAITLLGLGFTVWARVHLGRYWSGTITLKEGHKLIRTGPYKLARHPIYTGFLSGAIGSALCASTADALVGSACILLFVMIKIHREEAWLTEEFGDAYRRFKKEVAGLVPFVY